MTHYDSFRVKNALLNAANYVTEYSICSLISWDISTRRCILHCFIIVKTDKKEELTKAHLSEVCRIFQNYI